MEFVILGFLMIRDLTQYDLLKALERRVSPFYSASLGSIQATLKKLTERELIDCYQDTKSKRNKKFYHIRDTGKQAFSEMMRSLPEEKKFETQMSSKLFFLGLIPPADRAQVIRPAVDFLENQLSDFNEEAANVAKIEVKPEYQDLAAFQIKTLELGIYEYQNLLKWFKNLLRELEK